MLRIFEKFLSKEFWKGENTINKEFKVKLRIVQCTSQFNQVRQKIGVKQLFGGSIDPSYTIYGD